MILIIEPAELRTEASTSEDLGSEAPQFRVSDIASEINGKIRGGTSGAAAMSAGDYLDGALRVSEEDLNEYGASLRTTALLIEEADANESQNYGEIESAVAGEMGNDPTGTHIEPSLKSKPTERTKETGNAGAYNQTKASQPFGNAFQAFGQTGTLATGEAMKATGRGAHTLGMTQEALMDTAGEKASHMGENMRKDEEATAMGLRAAGEKAESTLDRTADQIDTSRWPGASAVLGKSGSAAMHATADVTRFAADGAAANYEWGGKVDENIMKGIGHGIDRGGDVVEKVADVSGDALSGAGQATKDAAGAVGEGARKSGRAIGDFFGRF